MPILAIIFILTAAVFHVLRDLMTKQSREKLLFVWWLTAISLLMLSPFSIYFIIKTQPALSAVGFALSMGLIHASYWVFYAKAYEKGDISQVYPIIHSAPAFVLVCGILFLNETPTLLGIIGILTITIGLYCIQGKKIGLPTWESNIRFSFFALIFVTAHSLLDKVAVSKIHPLVYIFFMTMSALSIFSLFIRKNITRSFLNPMKEEYKKVLTGALFASINYPLTLFALQMTHASYVSAFKQVSVIFAVIIGVLFLKERYSLVRIFSACLIFLGAILITI